MEYHNFKTSIIKKPLPPTPSLSPSSLLNHLFMSTVNTAAKTLDSVVHSSTSQNPGSWKLTDHFQYAGMLMTWFALWVLRVLMDFFPVSSPLLDGIAASIGYPSHDHSSYYQADSYSSATPSMDLVLHQGFGNSTGGQDYYYDGSIDISDQGGGGSSSTKSIGRALSHIFTLMNETPATSRKYQFVVSMADRTVDENVREGHAELQEVNRMALSYAFSRTYNLLYRSLQDTSQANTMDHDTRTGLFHSLPLGSYVESGLRFCLNSFLPFGLGGVLLDTLQPKKVKNQVTTGGWYDEEERVLAAEKLAQELLWITNKLRACGAVDEALGHWSLASDLASLSFSSHHRVQGLIVKITIILLGELAKRTDHHKESLLVEAPRQVKYRLLLLWLPLLCYANNGLSYPVLTGIEKAETERVIDQVISTLPASDQEIILTNWLQDYTNCSSDWPNLQRSYDQWCRSSRNNLLLLRKE
ncbi:hypothetical protein MKW94_012402 [Papaver nudicaule]|uniref:Uncharacterized protein n=1 Tax=Papaver nudicaule TaxID=74823 RepID=A0AA41VQF0_PAPNU|nr:hypothetical protein [Papaver nudicaule]